MLTTKTVSAFVLSGIIATYGEVATAALVEGAEKMINAESDEAVVEAYEALLRADPNSSSTAEAVLSVMTFEDKVLVGRLTAKSYTVDSLAEMIEILCEIPMELHAKIEAVK